MGILERGGEVRATVVGKRRKKEIHGQINTHVVAGSALYTDAFMSYMGLREKGFAHQVIDHAEKYVDGQVHTNGLENFWSLVKRGLKGTYISVEPFHLYRYLDEQIFRYNNRATKKNFISDNHRFQMVMHNVTGKRLTDEALIGHGIQGKP